MQIAYELLMPLPEVLHGLLGVYPLKLACHLRALLAAAQQGSPALSNSLMMSPKDLLAMLACDESKRHVRATPFGVKKLIELYEQETLPLRPGVVEWRPAPSFSTISRQKKSYWPKHSRSNCNRSVSSSCCPTPSALLKQTFRTICSMRYSQNNHHQKIPCFRSAISK